MRRSRVSSNLNHQIELNTEEVARVNQGEDHSSVVKDVAKRIGYHPSGYGCFNERISLVDGVLNAFWDSYRSCD